MKTTTLCLAASLLVFVPAFAADYFVVVPVKGRTAAAPAESISVSLNPYTLPSAQEGSAYSFDLKPLLTVTGDNAYTGAGVTWSVVSSSLPAGLYLTADGFIGGTPTSAGSGNITVRASYKTKAGEQTYQVVSAALTVNLVSAQLTNVTVGSAYSYFLGSHLTVDGDPSYSPGTGVTWSVTGGALPPGLSLTTDGVITGTSSGFDDAGVSFTARAAYKGKTSEATYSLQPKDPSWANVAAYLKMDGVNGSTTLVDEKGGSYTPYSVAISTAKSKVKQSAYFSGGTNKGVVGPAISLPGDFTIEMWVNPDSPSVSNTTVPLLAQWSQATNGGGYLLLLRQGAVTFYFMPYSGNAPMLTGATVSAGTWSHIALTRSGNTWRLFVNGVLSVSTTQSSPGPSLSVPMSLGNYINNSGTLGASGAISYQGYMDEVQVVKGVSRYNTDFIPPTYTRATR